MPSTGGPLLSHAVGRLGQAVYLLVEVIAVSRLNRGQWEEGPRSRKRVEGWVPWQYDQVRSGEGEIKDRGGAQQWGGCCGYGGWKTNQCKTEWKIRKLEELGRGGVANGLRKGESSYCTCSSQPDLRFGDRSFVPNELVAESASDPCGPSLSRDSSSHTGPPPVRQLPPPQTDFSLFLLPLSLLSLFLPLT